MALILALGTFGFVVRTTVSVAGFLAGFLFTNRIVGWVQSCCACVYVVVIIAVVIPTSLFASVLSDILAIAGVVSNTVRLVVNFIHMSGELIKGLAGVIRMEMGSAVLNV